MDATVTRVDDLGIAVEKVVTEEGAAGVAVQGRYRRADWPGAWILTHWRLRPVADGQYGDWHRISPRRKKDVGVLKLVLDATREDRTRFRFPAEVRKHVMALGDLMYYANSREDGRWASQAPLSLQGDGVYGYAYSAVKAIIRELLGADVAAEAMDRINYGGDSSFGLDIENAVQEAIDLASHTEE